MQLNTVNKFHIKVEWNKLIAYREDEQDILARRCSKLSVYKSLCIMSQPFVVADYLLIYRVPSWERRTPKIPQLFYNWRSLVEYK